ncbi:DsrE/DsrF/DrsH-like family protein [Ruminococcus sp.]|uniref:DsrE/DsrF/DrsH-like family protein n=1 Tax=Ruminococcus sp. TaxID=41978 RepID=UPI0025868FAC|nr:DsrE/DsrF/DrsH-like family protein [Ruminococcus sp.]MCR5022001.1 DsrE/DsrF/DrsH-like family protein [Ruminococcus sp.]
MEETVINNITPQAFLSVAKSGVTIVDIRERDEVITNPVAGAVNIPFSEISKRLSELDKAKTVYVLCRTGELSGEVTEILSDRGFEAFNIEGGYEAVSEYIKNAPPAVLDLKGIRCPGPVVRTAEILSDMQFGQRLLITSDESAFSFDIAGWCERTGNTLINLENRGGEISALIERNYAAKQNADRPDGKTFVLFSGDLDKTIAAFIMANAAASMGRNVTLFFTFWGLNILRRHEKVNVRKNIIEKMFGLMMPRGTKRLGLSRMNMGGMGAKMIRGIMKSKGVDTLEGLMESAKKQGVRLVACQMSMDIMGIRQEELIDGVELGGAATFIGSGEQSDMSLFI